MSTNLNLSAHDERPPGFESNLSFTYLEAVNASRFVKSFGITALVNSLLLFLGISILNAAVGIGAGLFILRYDDQKFYKTLGIIVMICAFIFPIPFLSTIALSVGVLIKGWQTLQTLGKEGKDDEDWPTSKKRATIGTICSGLGLLFTFIAIVLTILVLVAVSLGKIPSPTAS